MVWGDGVVEGVGLGNGDGAGVGGDHARSAESGQYAVDVFAAAMATAVK